MVMKRVDTVNGDGSEQAGETREVESLLCWEARHLEDAPTVGAHGAPSPFRLLLS